MLTTYAIRASALATDALVRECLVGRRGTTESGELAVIEEAGGRLLPTSHLHALDLGRCRLSLGAATRAITSLQNERVKLIRSLEMRKARRETGLFVAEGASVLVTARDAGWMPKMLAFLAGSARAGVHRALLDVGAKRRRGVPGGIRGRARQARGQGQSADHARRVRAALGNEPGAATVGR